jgi:uncharacterized membrane protein (DUF373 family)
MKQRITGLFEICEDVIYIFLGVLLVAVAGLVVYASVTAFVSALRVGDQMAGVIGVIDGILLGLMVAEILYTVIISFESHSLKAEPFLIVGLIAAVRRVLLISLEATHVYKLSRDVFVSYMIEMGLLTILILIFGVSIYLLRKQATSRSGSSKAEQAIPGTGVQ